METTKFANRHIGIEEKDLPQMLGKIGVKTLDELIDKTIPSQIRLKQPLPLAPAMTEREFAMHIANSHHKTNFTKRTSGPDGMTALHRPSSSVMSLKTPYGTPPIRLTRLKSHRDDWKPC